jgi:hypothetical protein
MPAVKGFNFSKQHDSSLLTFEGKQMQGVASIMEKFEVIKVTYFNELEYIYDFGANNYF